MSTVAFETHDAIPECGPRREGADRWDEMLRVVAAGTVTSIAPEGNRHSLQTSIANRARRRFNMLVTTRTRDGRLYITKRDAS